RASIPGKQEAADQMPAIHFAEGIELNQASRMGRCRKMFAGGILVLHEAFQGMHEPSPQRLTAIERPIVEFGTITQRKTCEEVAAIRRASLLESAPVAGALEQV